MQYVRLLVFVVILTLAYMAGANGLLLPWSAQSAAANCCGFLSCDAGRIFSYPALSCAQFSATTSRLYNMEELPRYIFTASKEWQNLSIGFGAEHLGHPDCKETSQLINLSYGAYRLRAGVNLRNIMVNITGEPVINSFSADLGAAWKWQKLETSVSWLNCFNSKLDGELLPVYIIWESAMEISEAAKLAVRIEKESGYEFQPVTGGSFGISKNLFLLASYSFDPAVTGCGFLIKWQQLGISYGLQYHSQLLETHYLSLSYEISG
jgi:hypothetical protein